jgi:general L-amino acid transport system permease protein
MQNLQNAALPRRGKPRSLQDLLYSSAIRTTFYQVLLAIAILAFGLFLYNNVVDNLARQNIATGFGFLGQVSNFDIGEKLIPYTPRSTYLDALAVGLVNTLVVSAAGIVIATLLGFLIGIARVSGNWMLERLALTYVEIVRNNPVILQAIFWVVVLRNLPTPKNALVLGDLGFLTNRGLFFAAPAPNPAHLWMWLALAAGIIACVVGNITARKYREASGKYVDMFLPGLALIFGPPLLVWLAMGAPTEISYPVHQGFNYVGGLSISPEFTALLIGISMYASGFIAEIVRSGIQATPKGQVEAARSIALKPRFVMRYVVLPQAMRVIVPPLTSQYVSLIKNSSIAVVVGYPDLVNIGNTMMNQTGQAVEAIIVMMVVYLAISLTASLVMNLFNRFVAIKER